MTLYHGDPRQNLARSLCLPANLSCHCLEDIKRDPDIGSVHPQRGHITGPGGATFLTWQFALRPPVLSQNG